MWKLAERSRRQQSSQELELFHELEGWEEGAPCDFVRAGGSFVLWGSFVAAGATDERETNAKIDCSALHRASNFLFPFHHAEQSI